jgi:SAM-dependent methyltransferase
VKQIYNTRGVINFYDENVRKHMNDIKSVAWGNRESQEKRFEILAQIAELSGKSVLDVGCGIGNFYSWLKDRYRDIKYTGVDITPSMVELALKNHPGVKFCVVDILELNRVRPAYDFVFASGIFNRRIPRHKYFIKDAIVRMFDLSKQGIAFNIMSTKADFMEKKEYYADPGKMLDFCLGLSRKVALMHNYMPHDFTVFIYKQH